MKTECTNNFYNNLEGFCSMMLRKGYHEHCRIIYGIDFSHTDLLESGLKALFVHNRAPIGATINFQIALDPPPGLQQCILSLSYGPDKGFLIHEVNVVPCSSKRLRRLTVADNELLPFKRELKNSFLPTAKWWN